MDGGADRPAEARGVPAAPGSPHGVAPLIGRRDALRAFGTALDTTSSGSPFFLGLVGDPGAGKTRLLGEPAADAGRRGPSCGPGHCPLVDARRVAAGWADRSS